MATDHSVLDCMKSAVEKVLVGIGEDVHREGLLDTPKRVAKALLDASVGYQATPAHVLGSAYFHEPIVHAGGNGVVLVRDIDFASTNERTLLPFHGRCHIAYVPTNGVVLGLSKLARITKLFAKRLQTQQRLGRELVAALHRQLQCAGVAIVIEARQVTMLDSQLPSNSTTACVSGCFTHVDSSMFQEMLMMLGIDDVPASQLTQLPEVATAKHSTHSLTGPSPPPTPDLSEHLSEQELASSSCSSHSDTFSERGQSMEPEQPDGSVFAYNAQGDVSCSRPCLDSYSSQPANLGHANDCGSDGLLSIPELSFRLRGLSDCEDSVPEKSGHHQIAITTNQPERLSHQLQQCVVRRRKFSRVPVHQDDECDAEAIVNNMEHAVQQLIQCMGESPERSGLAGSARQYISTLIQATSGYSRTLPEPLYPPTGSSASSCGASQGQAQEVALPVCRGAQQDGCRTGGPGAQQQGVLPAGLCHIKVPFNSQCEHHMLPFYGHVHVVYCLDDELQASRAACVSSPSEQEQQAIKDVVLLYTQRLQVQERITQQVASGVEHVLGGRTRSVLVLADAAHMCMVARGVENHAGHTTSMALRGAAMTDAAWRARALQACRAAGIA